MDQEVKAPHPTKTLEEGGEQGYSVEPVTFTPRSGGPGECQREYGTGGRKQKRTGTLAVHKLSCDMESLGQGMSLPSGRIEETGRISLDGGVLDCKWRPRPLDGCAIIACATSTGRLTMHSLCRSDVPQDPVVFQNLSASAGGGSLLLSLDWSKGAAAFGEAQVIISESDGSLSLWRCHPTQGSGGLIQERRWSAHTIGGSNGVPVEVWIAFFSHSTPSLVISGADDGLMKGWDLRVGGGGHGAGCSGPSFVCRRHGMGVTSGEWHPSREHVFASGSYDEIIRLWDIRKPRDPLSELPTGGGLWRLRWHPSPAGLDRHGDLLLAACMHAGVKVVETGSALGGGGAGPGGGFSGACKAGAASIVAEFDRHQSMAYGADWCHLEESAQSPQPLIASCSFYDNLLCLWQAPVLWDG
ncbi:unnamed protein product [Discosporangium mesarthrocarpum]